MPQNCIPEENHLPSRTRTSNPSIDSKSRCKGGWDYRPQNWRSSTMVASKAATRSSKARTCWEVTDNASVISRAVTKWMTTRQSSRMTWGVWSGHKSRWWFVAQQGDDGYGEMAIAITMAIVMMMKKRLQWWAAWAIRSVCHWFTGLHRWWLAVFVTGSLVCIDGDWQFAVFVTGSLVCIDGDWWRSNAYSFWWRLRNDRDWYATWPPLSGRTGVDGGNGYNLLQKLLVEMIAVFFRSYRRWWWKWLPFIMNSTDCNVRRPSERWIGCDEHLNASRVLQHVRNTEHPLRRSPVARKTILLCNLGMNIGMRAGPRKSLAKNGNHT